MVIAVTGASGFIGKALVASLVEDGAAVRALTRSRRFADPAVDAKVLGNIEAVVDWGDVWDGVTTLIHLAGRAHVLRETASDSLAAFRAVNVEGSKNVALAAARRGVKRLVFVSSIGVLGSSTENRAPFNSADLADPSEPYALSKWEAELALESISEQTGLELVIVRPPLVYGPEAGGNFARLVRLVRAGVPLPLAAVKNQRSLVGVDNLVDLLRRCADDPLAAGGRFLVSDGEDLSTPELLLRLAEAMGRKARLFPLPNTLLRVAGRLLGRGNEIEKMMSSLRIDIGGTCDALQWRPPVSVELGLLRAVT